MSRYTSFSTLGTHRDAPRFWAEGRRLADLGFVPGESLAIATTVAGLRVHNKRHADAGHGFAMKILDGSESSAPVICKSYYKINSSGFFIATPYGPRMVRKAEIERLQGQRIVTDHYATAVQMMGQGVLTRVFANIFLQLATFLA